jgi:Phytanoyl-CoA dioxygenase (PhyH)
VCVRSFLLVSFFRRSGTLWLDGRANQINMEKSIVGVGATATANDDNNDDTESVTSDDALCELLGISSLDLTHCKDEFVEVNQLCPNRCMSVDDLVLVEDSFIKETIEIHGLWQEYHNTRFCVFPNALSVPSNIMRRLTDELVWGRDLSGADRTFEPIKHSKDGIIQERSTLTRIENLNGHIGWYQLCNNYVQRCISTLIGEEMILYKTKLNMKPAGGSGFAPHVDAPSLRSPFGIEGPQHFVTVMVAVDNMTVANGCLRVAKGDWANEDSCPVVPPEPGANPDAGGRAGAIPVEIANTMDFTNVCCPAGTICAFDGWAPHRSGANRTNFARRAVFLTYNLASEGDYHDMYYRRMKQLRNIWRASVGLERLHSPSSKSFLEEN